MRTLKEVKERLAPGTEVEVINHVRPQDSSPRVVHKNQKKYLAWKTPDGRILWLSWPRASELRFDGPDHVTFMIEKEPGTFTPFITIKFKP